MYFPTCRSEYAFRGEFEIGGGESDLGYSRQGNGTRRNKRLGRIGNLPARAGLGSGWFSLFLAHIRPK
jgi:hypothetical protein